MPKISRVIGRRVWDSRGRPTVEADIVLDDGASGRAIAPAGASTGSGEATDLRDGGKAFGGYDVKSAVGNLNSEIAAALTGLEVTDQRGIDDALIELDGTDNASHLGGNAMIAVSMAALHASAASARVPLYAYLAGDEQITLPVPEIQILGGGAHAARRVDIQDFMIMCPSAGSVREALDRTAEVYRAAGKILADRSLLQGVADEGGWWPAFTTNEEALDVLTRAIEAAGYAPGEDAHISLDIAASEFGSSGRYRLGLEGREYDSDGFAEILLGWLDKYPILSIEDPFGEDDEDAFRSFHDAVGDRVQIVGDDLLVTNPARVERAHDIGSANCVLVKPNQAGTVSGALDALKAAKARGMATIVSARSGETEDVTIAHLAVGWNAGQIKVGSITRSERTAKWNELLRIEEALGSRASFAGWNALPVSRSR